MKSRGLPLHSGRIRMLDPRCAIAIASLVVFGCAGPAINVRETATHKVIDVTTRSGIPDADVLVFYRRTYANAHARTACEGVWRGKTDSQGEVRYPEPLNETRASFVALKDGYVDSKVRGGATYLEPRQADSPERIKQLFLYTTLECGPADKPLIDAFLAPLAPEIEAAIATRTAVAGVLGESYRARKQPTPPSCDPNAPVTCPRRQPPPSGG